MDVVSAPVVVLLVDWYMLVQRTVHVTFCSRQSFLNKGKSTWDIRKEPLFDIVCVTARTRHGWTESWVNAEDVDLCHWDNWDPLFNFNTFQSISNFCSSWTHDTHPKRIFLRKCWKCRHTTHATSALLNHAPSPQPLAALAFNLQPLQPSKVPATDFDTNLAARLGVQKVWQIWKNRYSIYFYFWHSLTLLQAKPVPCKSCVVLPFCPFGMSRHQLKHAKIESSSLFKVHVQRNCLRTTSGHIGSNGLSKQFGISLQTMGKSWGAYFGNTTLHKVWVWSKSLQSKTLFDWLIDWWLFRFRWVDSTQEDWVLVQDCAGKTASSNGMKSHIHCLHGFCTQVCFCLFWFAMGRFCCLALTYLGSNSNRDSYSFYDRNAMCH